MIRISEQILVKKQKKDDDNLKEVSTNSENGETKSTLDTIVNQDPNIDPNIGQIRPGAYDKRTRDFE